MKTNLPTTPGPWWFREEDGDEWELVLVVFYNDPFIEPTAKYVCSEFENDLKDMEGQWAKAHRPDEGVEAWAVFNQTTSEMVVSWEDEKETQTMCNNLNQMSIKHKYTCEPVTICRKEKE